MTEADAVRLIQQWRQKAPDAVMLDGFHALKHALRFGADIRLVLTGNKATAMALAHTLADDVASLVDKLAVEIPEDRLRELLPRVHPTGIVALATRPSTKTNLDALARLPRSAPIIVLDNPRNLGNVGAVIRLAAGFDATGVVTTGDTDPWHPQAVRASAGLHFATAVERVTSVAELPPGPLYVLDPEGRDIRSITVPDNALLAFGSERHGISAAMRSKATELVAIPMRPQVSSFNLATSVGMALFHWASSAQPVSTHTSPYAATHAPSPKTPHALSTIEAPDQTGLIKPL